MSARDSQPAQETSLWANRRCLLVCCAVATANMQYGFDSAAVGALQAMPGFLKVFGYEDATTPIGYGIDSTVQQLISSLLTLGSFLSPLAAGAFSRYLGRKAGLWLACLVNAVSCAIQLGTKNIGVLYLGRLLMGLSNGFFVTFSNVYLAEVAPAHLRGVVVALFAYWVNIGSIVGAVVVNYTSKRLDTLSYQIPIACLYIVPAFLALVLLLVPESARWLLYQGKEADARAALMALREYTQDPLLVEREWVEMLRGVEEERESANSIGFLDMFQGISLRRTLLCYGVIAAQTGSGVWFCIGYSTYFFSVAGITKSLEYSIMATCVGFAGVNFGMIAMKKLFGRRSMLIVGAAVCGVAQLVPTIIWSLKPMTKSSGNLLVRFIALFQFTYNGGVGAVSYPVATELVNRRLRAWTVGTATSLGYVLAWLCSSCSPYFINPENLGWGAQYGYIWAGSNFLCVAFFYFCIPEMKGKSLEHLDDLFEAKVPAREFRSFHCRVTDQMSEGARAEDAKSAVASKVDEVA